LDIRSKAKRQRKAFSELVSQWISELTLDGAIVERWNDGQWDDAGAGNFGAGGGIRGC